MIPTGKACDNFSFVFKSLNLNQVYQFFASVDKLKNIKPTAIEIGKIASVILTYRGALILNSKTKIIGKKSKAYANCLNVRPKTIFSLYSSC